MVSRPSFNLDTTPLGKVHPDTLYGIEFSVSNFTLQLQAYFVPTMSGRHEFMLYAKDGASLQIGKGISCCYMAVDSVTNDYLINTIGTFNGRENENPDPDTASVNLVKDKAYPIRVVVFDQEEPAMLDLFFRDSDGTHTDWSNHLRHLNHELDCLGTTTTTWSKSFTSTQSSTTVFNTQVIVHVHTPTKTVTSYWTGKSTLSTATGVKGQHNTVIVKLPKPYVSKTATWTGSVVVTTTHDGTATGTVIVRVPTPTVTITTYWTGKATTTSAKGGTGHSNTVIVKLPKSSTTTTATWTGSVIVTKTLDGTTTDTIVVEVPTPTATVTSYWTGSATTDFEKGEEGHSNTVIVKLPKSYVTETVTWTGLVVVTKTHDGTTTDTIIVEVPTPTVTITTYWTGSATTGFEKGEEGHSNTVIVKLPTTDESERPSTTSSNGFESESVNLSSTTGDSSVSTVTTTSSISDGTSSTLSDKTSSTSSDETSSTFSDETSSTISDVTSSTISPFTPYTTICNELSCKNGVCHMTSPVLMTSVSVTNEASISSVSLDLEGHEPSTGVSNGYVIFAVFAMLF